jgi:hypothetical protein
MFVIEKYETIFQEFPEIIMGVTNREEDFRASVMESDMVKLSQCLGVARENVKVLSQIHSNEVMVVNDVSLETEMVEADAMVTNLPDVVLGVKTADCVPVLLYDPVLHVIGAAHAGRKGAKAGVVKNTVKVMVDEYGVNPRNLCVYLGPSLGADDHAVFAEEAVDGLERFIVKELPLCEHAFSNLEHKRAFQERTGISDVELASKQTVYVDLSGFIRSQLLELGVDEERIRVSLINTMRDNRFHSYRRDFPNHGLMLSCIGMRV